MDYLTSDTINMMKTTKEFLQRMYEADTTSEKLQHAAEFEYLYTGMRVMVAAFAESTDKVEMQMALEYLDEQIKELANNQIIKFNPNNGTPSA